MHYYQFHIGDYKSHTHHLSLLEDLAYRRLLDFYFLHENPIKHRDIARQIGMRDHEEDVITVLNEFFISTADGFVNPRADKEIKQYKEFSEAGKRGAAKRWSTPPNGEANSPPNATPIATINHKPITNNQNTKRDTAVAVCPINVDEQVWSDFLALRKVKKAPMTVTALAGIKKEADKANWSLDKAISECVARGWTGFKADWVAEKANRFDVVLTTTPPPPNQDAALKRILEDDKKASRPSLEVLAKMAEVKRKIA
jgi:uncharacterized protein YdaU (DUF1376 family)